jgi:hypothetical protein
LLRETSAAAVAAKAVCHERHQRRQQLGLFVARDISRQRKLQVGRGEESGSSELESSWRRLLGESVQGEVE